MATPRSAPEDLVRGDREGSFAWSVLAQRHPALVDQVGRAHPYGRAQLARLDALRGEITGGAITDLPRTAHDHAAWRRWLIADGGSVLGRSWFEVPFLIAESFFYRRLLEAVDYYTAGPWAGVDPFEPVKSAQLVGLAAMTPPADLDGLLLASLWGNRADLGFHAGAVPAAADPGPGGGHTLVVDERAELRELLTHGGDGRIDLVADNAGLELLADLLLVDHLLAEGRARQVVVHVKPAPYFVSDAMGADVSAGVRALAGAGPHASAAARRLSAAAAEGVLVISTDGFYCTPGTFHDMPPALAAHFAGARLVLLKGDLNYRRLVGDRYHDPESAFAAATRYFPAPVATLRTLKSDVILGVDGSVLAALDAAGEPWRTAGTHALIQARC